LSTIAYDTASIRVNGEKRKAVNKNVLKQIKQGALRQTDQVMQDMHEKAFDEINCLTCANCCKTTSPIITDRDIDRIAKYLKTKPSDLVSRYMRVDEDQDYIFKSAPCPFLGADNHCGIYEVRPAACRTYPHTDRKKFQQLTELTYKNSFICPAVQRILQLLEMQLSEQR
jgi:Fe-S-cluster containining protein